MAETKTTTTRTRATRRTPAKKAPAKAVAVVQDAMVPEAAPTKVGPNGEMIRDTNAYTVDLLSPGSENEKRDFDKLLAKDPSELHVEAAEWIHGKTGYKPDVKTLQLVLALYHEFQRSPEHKARTIAKRQEAAAKKGAAVKAKQARAAKAAAALSAEQLQELLAAKTAQA